MDSNDIARLINGYYEASLSPAEEAGLRDYLRDSALDPQFEADRDIILSLHSSAIDVPEDLNLHLARNIDR